MASGSVLDVNRQLRVMGNILAVEMLERFSEILKIVSVESGAGWVPYLLEGLEYMASEGGAEFDRRRTDVFHRQIYVCSFLERKNLSIPCVRSGRTTSFETDFRIRPASIDEIDYMVDVLAELVRRSFKSYTATTPSLQHQYQLASQQAEQAYSDGSHRPGPRGVRHAGLASIARMRATGYALAAKTSLRFLDRDSSCRFYKGNSCAA